MKKLVVGIACFIALNATLPGVASAQGAEKSRLFGGFSYLRVTSDPVSGDPGVSENTFGLQGNYTYYFSPLVGFTVDGAFNTGSILPDDPPEGVTDASLTQTTLLFGPRILVADSDTLRFEGYGAIGIATGSIDVRGVNENDLPVFERLDRTVFASSFGVSLDMMFGGGNWGIRLVQPEILLAFYPDEALTNFRVSAGIVGRF